MRMNDDYIYSARIFGWLSYDTCLRDAPHPTADAAVARRPKRAWSWALRTRNGQAQRHALEGMEWIKHPMYWMGWWLFLPAIMTSRLVACACHEEYDMMVSKDMSLIAILVFFLTRALYVTRNEVV